MKTIRIDDYQFSMPSSWEEVDKRHFVALSELSSIDGISEAEFRLRAFLIISGLKVSPLSKKTCKRANGSTSKCHLFRRGRAAYFIAPEDLNWMLYQVLNFIFAPTGKEDNSLSLDYRSSRTIIDYIMVGSGSRVKYFGPGSAMSNCIFEEYIAAQVHYERWRQTSSDIALNKLIAVLYRPAGTGLTPDDPRCTFDDNYTLLYAEKIAAVEMEVKKAIALQYSGHLWAIEKLFPEPFESTGTKKGAKRDIMMEYMELTNSLASNDVTKNEAVRRSKLYDVLSTMCSMYKQMEEIKRKRKK